MIASITGVGWINTKSMGWGRSHEDNPSGDGRLPRVTSRMIFGKGLPHFGRLDTYSKIGIAAIAYALKDAGRFDWDEKRAIGIIASTTCGCIERDMEYIETVLPNSGRFASPSLFACTLPNVFFGQAAINLGLTGPCYSLNQDEPFGVAGLRMALNNLRLDEPPAMIVGLCDAGCPDSFESLKETRPGALFFVLETSRADKSLSYGDIAMDEKGDVTFNSRRVEDLWELLEACLKREDSTKRKVGKTVSVTGVGWIDTKSMGWGRSHEDNPSGDGRLPRVTSRMIFGKGLTHFGRLDTYSKIGIAAIAYALKDAKRFEWQAKRPIGIVASTQYGCLEADVNFLETMLPHEGRLASPSLFAYVLSNTVLGEAAIHFGLTGPSYCLNEEEPSGMTGLRMALNDLSLNETPVLIVGFCDSGRGSFDGMVETTPGALFFVIEESPPDKSLSYGTIELDEKGNVYFEGAAMTDLHELRQMCLSAGAQGKAQKN